MIFTTSLVALVFFLTLRYEKTIKLQIAKIKYEVTEPFKRNSKHNFLLSCIGYMQKDVTDLKTKTELVQRSLDNLLTRESSKPTEEVAIDHIQLVRQEVDKINAKLSAPENSELQQVYVQSLAGITKGIDAILERQEKSEKHMVSLVNSLNKLTQQ